MWKEVLLNYGVFLLELLTIFGVVGVIVMLILDSRKQPENGTISLTNLSEKIKEERKLLAHSFLSDLELKQQQKAEKKAEKAQRKEEKKRLKEEGEKSGETRKARLFVLHFLGDLQANAVENLRKEIDAVVALADPVCDEVLLNLESPGGVVHGYGLAASQLQRLKDRQIPLTVSVDKIAASGGYMMACVANKIVSAPFAIIGSIGVVAQVPNIHRLLKKHDIDVDVMTAGEYKRTVTLVGENTEKGKQKFQQELEETHGLFKQFVAQHRPALDLDKVATGEHWFGQQALALGLVDEISSSDDLILSAIEQKEVIELKYHRKKRLSQRVGEQVEYRLENLGLKWLYRNRVPYL